MEHRILLLGCGEAGKSTFIKQMRIIHSGGFSDREKLEIKRAIANNILSAVQGGMCAYDVCMGSGRGLRLRGFAVDLIVTRGLKFSADVRCVHGHSDPPRELDHGGVE